MTLLQTLVPHLNQLVEHEFSSDSKIWLAFLSTSLLIYALLIHPLYFGPYAHIPGPPLFKTPIGAFVFSIYDVLLLRNYKISQWHRKYGPILVFSPGEVSFCSWELMREIYGTAGRYVKTDLFDNFIVYGERPLFATKEHSEHSKKRSRIAGFYQKKSIYTPEIDQIVRDNARKIVEGIEEAIVEVKGRPVRLDAYSLFTFFAFDNITQIQFGAEYVTSTIEKDCHERKILRDMKHSQMWGPTGFNFGWLVAIFQWASNTLPKPFGDLLVPEKWRLCTAAESDLADWNWKIIQSATKNPAAIDKTCLLYRMLAFKDKEDLRLSYIAAEIFDLGIAGIEAVATGMIYFAFHMSMQSDWQQKIREELKTLSVVDNDGYPSFTAIDALPLLDAFLRETQRLNPVASARGERYVKKGGQVFNGIYLPQNTRLTSCTIGLHHDPEAFPLPEEFLPERWLEKDVETLKRMERSFIPFGYGARSCPGQALGTMELKLMLAFLLLRYELEAVPEMGDGKSGPMWQCGSFEAVPVGLRGDIVFRRL